MDARPSSQIIDVDSLGSANVSVRKDAARKLAKSTFRVDQTQAILSRFQLEQEPSVIKWLAVSVAQSADPLVPKLLRSKLDQLTDSNARDWVTVSMSLAGYAPPIDMNNVPTYDALLAEWAIPGRLTKAQLLEAASSDEEIRRRWSVLIAKKRGIILPDSEIQEDLTAPSPILREWAAYYWTKTKRSAGHEEEVLEHFLSEVEPRVLEWMLPIVPFGIDPSTNRLIIEHARIAQDEEVLLSLISRIAKFDSDDTYDLLGTIIPSIDDPVIVYRALGLVEQYLDPNKLREVIPAARDKLMSAADSRPLAEKYALTHMTPVDRTRVLATLATPLGAMLFGATSKDTERMTMYLADIGSNQITVALYIALKEELILFEQALGIQLVAVKDESDGSYYLHAGALSPTSGKRIDLYIACDDQKGEVHAADATARLIRFCSPQIVCSIGIAGALDKDLAIGDVVVVDTIEQYLQNAKIQDSPAGPVFWPAGVPFNTDRGLSDLAFKLDMIAGHAYERFGNALGQFECMRGRNIPQISRGITASGPYVGDSGAFKEWIKRQIRRDFKVIEMETAGVAKAVQSERVTRPRLVALRGVSDAAEDKKDADSSPLLFGRDRAMLAASCLLLSVLEEHAGVQIWH